MVRYFFTILLLFSSLLLMGQSVSIDFSGYGNITSVSGTGPTYTLNIGGFLGSPRFQNDGVWIPADVQAGNVVWLDCARFEITTVNSTTTNSMNVVVMVPAGDWALGVSTPLAGQRVAVLEEVDGIPTAIPQTGDGNGGYLTGIDNSLYSCIMSHYMKSVHVSIPDATSVVGNSEINVVVTPGVYTLSLEPQGAASGQVLKWNGTTWVPSNDLTGGTGAAIDSVLVKTSTNGIEVKVNTTSSTQVPVPPNALSSGGAVTGQVLRWNGTDYAPATVDADWEEENFPSVSGNTIITVGTLPTLNTIKRVVLYRTGVKMTQGVDYTLSGNNFTLTLPAQAESFSVRYK